MFTIKINKSIDRKMKWNIFAMMIISFCVSINIKAQRVVSWNNNQKKVTVTTNQGLLELIPLFDNAIRVKFIKQDLYSLPEWVYIEKNDTPEYDIKEEGNTLILSMKKMKLIINKETGNIVYSNDLDCRILAEKERHLTPANVQGVNVYCAEQIFESPQDEYLYGLGQFQDGYLNVRGLSRRLTQVNTQISIPFLLSNKGYGLLWNNYGLTDFNPLDVKVEMLRESNNGVKTLVDVTSTEGGKQEVRENNCFTSTFSVPEKGYYSILLDVGQKMARRHHLEIDGRTIFEVDNVWLPPTFSAIVQLEKGNHKIHSVLTRNDKPVFYYKRVTDETVFRSPVANNVDYTIFSGTPDDVISTYRALTGQVPLIPRWALGYIHCRERFRSQEELLATARNFRDKKIPMDVIVQDWQYWGKYGWNAMRFDESHYPAPKNMVEKLHAMDIRLMLSVWSKIDPKSVLGKQAELNGFFIPKTQWIDFFNPEAADFYWQSFSDSLLKPYQIDAWWQDATEPENDDLLGHFVMNNTLPGEVVRNVYPLLVNKTVYEGLRKDDPKRRTMILTRSGFLGMQRYGAATWSGDVGNDWGTFQRQIIAGLGMMASGMPWWTYDAGGFFRPENQYTDVHYHECFLRWLQTSVFLPLMRVHGYKTDTEFWNYGEEVMRIARISLDLRYRLLQYIYSEAAGTTFNGSTLMRPLVMDYSTDITALSQKYEFMFGKSLLIAPVVDENPLVWSVYLPENEGGWYDFWTGERYTGGTYVNVPVSIEHIPVFVKAGSILPLGECSQTTEESTGKIIEVRVYPGEDGTFTLYDDEGINYNYEKGQYATVRMNWDDKKGELTLAARKGAFPGMIENKRIKVVKVGKGRGTGIGTGFEDKVICYKGKLLKIIL